MEYKSVPFDPSIQRENPADGVAVDLQKVIANQARDGWEFVGLQNHSSIVPGSSGCFGFGETSPYAQTVSVAVFKK